MIPMALVGAILSYESVPYWDMWDGTIEFLIKISNREYFAWWEQHNEHRIILSKLLFYVDERYFGGAYIFLVVVNFFLVVTASVTFYLMYRRLVALSAPSDFCMIIVYFICMGLLFSWVQKENFTWGFQSQFFLVFTLPLLSLQFATYHINSGHRRYFFISLLLATLSTVAMANGVLTLPILLFYYLIMSRDIYSMMLIITTSALTILIYFWEFSFNPGHGNFMNGLVEDPLVLMKFTFAYMGSVFFHLFGQNIEIAILSGIFICMLFFYSGIKEVLARDKVPEIIALNCFILYVLISAFVTAGGRYVFGDGAAVASRYSTPSIMAFSALALSITYKLENVSFSYKKYWVGFLLFISITAFGYQLNIFRTDNSEHAKRQLAALALELNIKHEDVLKILYPSSDRVLELARIANEKNISYYKRVPFNGLSEKIGQTYVSNVTKPCSGQIVKIVELELERLSYFLQARLSDYISINYPDVITITNQENEIIGFALKRDSKKNTNSSGEEVLFDISYHGYFRNHRKPSTIHMHMPGSSCRLTYKNT